MQTILWIIIMVPCSALFTALGIYAMKREKPMWFWSGSEVSEYEIEDIPAYNRANGKMWLIYSAGFWAATVAGFFHLPAAGIIVGIWSVAGIPFLIIAYKKIYNKYKY